MSTHTLRGPRALWALLVLTGATYAGLDLSTPRAIGDAMLAAMKDLAHLLDSIKDKDTAKAARPGLLKLAKRQAAIWAAIEKLGKLKAEEEKELRARFGPALKEMQVRTSLILKRLRGDPALWAVVEPMMDEYVAAFDPQGARKQLLARRVHKINNVRHILSRLRAGGGKLPMKDGKLDVYALVRSGKVGRKEFDLFRIPKNKRLPTDKEIEKGDYTNFPYDRYRGSAHPDPKKPVPLLWEKKPDAEGVFVVGMSSGVVRGMKKKELAKALGKKEKETE